MPKSKIPAYLRVVPGGLCDTHIYRGHVSGKNKKIIVAKSANEAYALMLDALAGCSYETNEVYTDPEKDPHTLLRYRHLPVGVYNA